MNSGTDFLILFLLYLILWEKQEKQGKARDIGAKYAILGEKEARSMAQRMRAYELPLLGTRVFLTVSGQKELQEDYPAYYSHKHPYYELHVIEAGSTPFHAEGQTYALTPGDFCLVYPGTVHIPAEEQPGVIRGAVSFELTDTKGELACLLSCQSGSYRGNSKDLAAVWHRLQREQAAGLFSDEMIKALLTQMLILLVRAMRDSITKTVTHRDTLDQLRTVYIDTFLNNRFFLRAGESVLAEELGVSRRQLDRIFQKLYGKSYREKLLEVRTEVACELLREDLPIREIAERVGYDSSSNFTAFFKSMQGITPTQYRKMLRD